jgi:hypothetical protein
MAIGITFICAGPAIIAFVKMLQQACNDACEEIKTAWTKDNEEKNDGRF